MGGSHSCKNWAWCGWIFLVLPTAMPRLSLALSRWSSAITSFMDIAKPQGLRALQWIVPRPSYCSLLPSHPKQWACLWDPKPNSQLALMCQSGFTAVSSRNSLFRVLRVNSNSFLENSSNATGFSQRMLCWSTQSCFTQMEWHNNM